MQQLIQQFGVDWKLFIAQVINFAILLLVLRRYAYKPIIAMLNERRKKIAEGMAASDEAKRKLAQAEADHRAIITKAEGEAVQVVAAAQDTARERASVVIAEAEKKTEHIFAAGERKLEEDRRKLEDEFMEHAEALIKKGLAVTIGKMSVKDKDEALIKEALRELKTLS